MNEKTPTIKETFELAVQNQKKGNHEVAKDLYNKILEVNPIHASAHCNLGVIFKELGEREKAKSCFEKAIEILPNYPDAHNNLGTVFQEMGEHEKAIISYQKTIDIQLNHADAHNNFGNVLKELGKYEKAIKWYQKVIEIQPNHIGAYNNLGIAYQELGDTKRAIDFYQKAVRLNPKNNFAYYNLGNVYRDLGDIKKSIDFYKKALDIKPDFFKSYNDLLICTCYSFEYHNYLEIAKKFDNNLTKLKKKEFINSNKSKNKTLKIGFLSADFREHVIGFYLLDFLKSLRNKDVELYAYSNNYIKDNITRILKKSFNVWTEIYSKTDLEVIDLIRKDNLNILIDLSGHTSGNRLVVFKNKCAPIQATWCGWLASTGIEEIDYIIGDPYATPLNDQYKFVEKIYPLNKIWCSLSTSNLISGIRISKSDDKYITYGSFNNIKKINDEVILTWSKILKQVSNSRLLLKYPSYDDKNVAMNVLQKFKSHGINDEKIVLEGQSPRLKLLKYYNKIDIALDTFPYNGGTTNFEAAYMGVPIVTMENNSFMFRSGESINKNLKMDDWIAKNKDDYVTKVIKYSENKNYLAQLKYELKNIALKSPLFDSDNFGEDFYNMLLSINKG